jgi:hypothetical protein
MKPRRIRLMVDDVAGIALWDDGVSTDRLEDELPLPDDLRQRVRSWVDEYTRSIDRSESWTTDQYVEFDRRGHQLSIELQQVLGPEYRIQYDFMTQELRQKTD